MSNHHERLEDHLKLARMCAGKTKIMGTDRNDFRRARLVLSHAIEEMREEDRINPQGLNEQIVLEYALSWLEDPDIHRLRAADRAWDVMAEHFPDLDAALDAEVLQLLGKIHRRRWDISAQSRDLRRAVYFYQLGHTARASDRYTQGLNGFHAALLMVDLARLEERAVYYLEGDTDYSSRVPPINQFSDDPRAGSYVDRLRGLTSLELRRTARGLFLSSYEILSGEASRPDRENKWAVNTATAAALFGLRRYDEAARYADRASKQAVDGSTAPDEQELQGWAHEFVAMARQRGIRPDAESVRDALEHHRDTHQAPDTDLDPTTEAALERLIALESQAVDHPDEDPSPAPIEVVTDEFPFESVAAARNALIRAEQAKVFKVVDELLYDVDRDAVVNAFKGKLGVALSGGGFRASLYHVGVLAALAELGLLRDVQVLSCVSGGSITGACYYLLAKQLLSTKLDAVPEGVEAPVISNDDYVQLVKQLVTDMTEAAGHDLRGRLFLRPGSNLQFLLNYSPSQRLGDLIADNVLPKVRSAPGAKKRPATHLSDLAIYPLTHDQESGELTNDPNFRPRRMNWTRSAKVPVLIMNATALNTGHNWQLTALYMGEPPASVDPEIDAVPRLRRMYFDPALLPSELQLRRALVAPRRTASVALERSRRWAGWRPRSGGASAEDVDEGSLTADERERLKDLLAEIQEEDPRPQVAGEPIKVGHAVAASAAVPGVFDPLPLDTGPADLTIKLLDGGVVDNQGITGLTEQNCDLLLISDASGQLSPQPRPRGGFSPAMRSSLISLQRIRAAQYDDLKKQRRSQQIRDFTFVHLARDVKPPVDGDSGAYYEELTEIRKLEGNTEYGVDRRIQSALAEMRTDLDSFSELEAYSLMTSGYLTTRFELGKGMGPFRFPTDSDGWIDEAEFPSLDWEFLKARDLIGKSADPTQEPDLARRQKRARRHLEASRRRFFRSVPKPVAQVLPLVLALAFVVGLAILAGRPGRLLPTVVLIVTAAVVAFATLMVWVVGLGGANKTSLSGALAKVLIFIASIVAMVASWLYFGIRWLIRYRRGRIKRYLP